MAGSASRSVRGGRASVSLNDIDRGWKKLAREMAKLNVVVDAGYYDTQRHDKERKRGRVVSREGRAPHMAEIAAVHVFGSPKKRIPPRDFMASAVAKFGAQWFQRALDELRAIMDGRGSAKRLGLVLGIEMVNGIKLAITEGQFIALAESTKAKKGSSAPLIDTGAMRNATTFRVRPARGAPR